MHGQKNVKILAYNFLHFIHWFVSLSSLYLFVYCILSSVIVDTEM